MRLARIAREPLLHFAALGAVLFIVYGVIQKRFPEADRRITVDPALLDRLGDSFRRAWKREPTRDELAELVLDQINDEVLYREALALHFDRDDPAVRRRLIEKMAVSRQTHQAPPEPSPAELRRWFEERRHHFREPGRLWFEQIFFDPRLRRAAINDDARAALAQLQRPEAAVTGDPSPLPLQVKDMPEMQVAHLFGKGFLDSLASLEVGRWQGPLSSTQGLHLVRLAQRQPARDPGFDEARAAVRADWITARSKGYLDAAAGLRPRYHIDIAPAARHRLEGTLLLAPVLAADPSAAGDGTRR